MRTHVLLLVSVVLVPVIFAEDVRKRTDYFRNFYGSEDEHAEETEQFLQTLNSTHKLRHGRHIEERKINKIKRCRRYAQIYYQNYVPANCYYTACRQNYCGYCPTASCRRRCECVNPTPTPARVCSCDKHGSKIQACDQNTGKCICKPHYEGPKCDRCESTYYNSSSVCTSCNCDPAGSIDPICNRATGQCNCKPGVQGRRCDSCQEKHYGNVVVGCKPCDPCEKEGHICHPKNGRCVCPDLTEGRKCELCVANSWGHEPGIGCKPCGCSMAGSSSLQCDVVRGNCTCKPGFKGEKCDKCCYGYHGYPNCRECQCNVAGTVPEDCTNGICKCSEKGCRCKPNVEGTRCDRCKKGTFHPLGCIPCFCSNRSRTCTTSNYVWDHIRTTNIDQATKASECINGINCWNLPSKFSGDLIPSYGGYLRITTNSPKNFVYLTGNNMTIEIVTDSRGYITLTETKWKLKNVPMYQRRIPDDCYEFLTRDCFLIVLQNVTRIQIEPRPASPDFRITESILDIASNVPGSRQAAATVENCTCPKEYSSSSCQDPNKGYYRYRPQKSEPGYSFIDRILGVAKPCQCNNRSDNCHKETGHCLNCRDFTTGPHCDSCAEGYYKDLQGNCSPCLCPSETRNFAVRCQIDKSTKRFACICKAGYTGAKCDQCADSYWGNPLNPDGSCQPCNCHPKGSVNLRCHKVTGQCQCKSGFMGDKCSKCSSPREVIEDGVCIPCDECTQILFHNLDKLSNGLNNTLDLFRDGIGPPWRLLNSTMSQYIVLSGQFDNLHEAETIVDKANLSLIESKIRTFKMILSNYERLLNNQSEQIDHLHRDATNKSKIVQDLDKKIDDLIKNINGFGKSHIDVHMALREAEKLLRDIVTMANAIPTYEDLFTKCQNFSTQVNKIYEDGLNTTTLSSELAELKNRLKHLNGDIDQADRTNRIAKSRNERNKERVNKLKLKIIDFNSNTTVVNETILNILRKLNATNILLEDLKDIYSQLSQIDLEELTEDLDKDETEDIYKTLTVVRGHVKDLQSKIQSYRNIFNFTTDEWTKIDATGAYENIVKGIERARIEAEKAKNVTIETLKKLEPEDDDSLLDRTSLAKAFSDRIKKRVENLEKLSEGFKNKSEELEELKHKILMNGKNNNELNSFLREVLNNITYEDLDRLREAKNDAKNITSLIMTIEKNLKNMRTKFEYGLNKTYVKYLDLVNASKIASLKNDTKLTRKQLEKFLVDFDISNNTTFDKVNRFNNITLTKGLELQIKNLDNLIKDANNKVEAVEYGINIKNCQRHYKLRNEFLRSLEINFKCDNCDLFSITNSNKESINITYRTESNGQGKLLVVWREETKELLVSPSASFRSLSIKREGFRVSIKLENNETAILDSKPFELDSDHLLQVGSVQTPNSSEACLHKIRINNKTMGLWKFQKTDGNCTACYRNDTNNDGLVDVFFNGHGYREICNATIKDLKPTQLNIKLNFRTFDENSLLFLAQDRTNQCSFIALNLKNGYLEFKVRHSNGLEVNMTSKRKYNYGDETNVELTMAHKSKNQTYKLALPESEGKSINQSLNPAFVYKIKMSRIFVGGTANTFDGSCVPVNKTSFLGNLRVTLMDVDISKQNSESVNIETRLEQFGFPNAWFPGNGSADLTIRDKIENITFIFRPVEVADNYVMTIGGDLHIHLQNSNLIFKNESNVTFSSINIKDYNVVFLNGSGITVNDDYKEFPIQMPSTTDLHLGTHTDYSSFVGSIGDIFINNRPLLFDNSSLTFFQNVEIGRDRPLPKSKSKNEMQNTERYLTQPSYKTEPQAFKFGDKPYSFVFIKNSSMGKKFILEFQFRTFYPNGLLFLANSQANKNVSFYTILEIQGGDIRLQVQGHRAKIMKMREKLNDGTWHYVQVEQILGKKKWRLVVKVDKKWKVKDRAPRNCFWELYFGGVSHTLAVHKKLKNELHPFRGCIRSLKINKNPQIVKNNNNIVYNNIGQCFQNVEEGAYFGGDAYAIYKYDFKVDKFLELSFEFKTSDPNGILLSVSNFGNSPALSVELQNGAVVMTIDMGNGIISQVTNSPHRKSTLANNEWHNITALYSSSELTVNVDGIRKSWVQSEINSMMDEIEAPLYVGGLPGDAPSGTLKIKENFKGCIRKFQIEDNIMDWTDMKKLNNVQLNSCLA